VALGCPAFRVLSAGLIPAECRGVLPSVPVAIFWCRSVTIDREELAEMPNHRKPLVRVDGQDLLDHARLRLRRA
jgi:hypothetical protein